MSSTRTVAVIGGGISGLAAALELSRQGVLVTVLEAADRLGGKLRVSEVGGISVDEGADSMLARVPEGVELAQAVGFGDELISPTAGQAHLWTRGRLRPLPSGTVMGIPGDLAALVRCGVLSARGLARVPADLVLPGEPLVSDVAVGAFVARRLGNEVVDRLVDPLLGGVYAGHAHALSLQMTLPQLVGPAAEHRSLLRAARQVRSAPAVPGPVFRGLPGGLGRLPAAVATASGADVRLSTPVRALSRTPSGWRLELGAAPSPTHLDVDGVVLAVPAAAAARLLRDLLPAAAAELAGIEYASVAIVTLVLEGAAAGTGSGYLVPAVEGRTTKAVTFTSRKWAGSTQRAGPAVVRASVGRHGQQQDLQRPDHELMSTVLAELAEAVGPVGRCVDSRVVRWGGGLPQYAPGHQDLVRRIRSAVAGQPGIAVAGAAYDGVGVPACARSGREAGRAVLGAGSWRRIGP